MKRQLESTTKEKQSQKGFCAFAAMVVAGGTFAATALIPAPREMDVQGGEYQVKAPPKVEVVAAIPSEGYELSIAPDGVTIRHSDGAGLFYAKKTLEQLATKNAKGNPTSYPCVEIKDAPAFRWRGVMLDEARHFFGKVAVKKILERMAFYKLNVFHWHLTDDQAWRIDIPGYPDLARLGTYRTGMCESEAPLFYSANDIREIVEYAKARHITIVPEIDFPGHFGAAVRAYPWLACPKGKKNVMCLGNPDAVRFAEKVIDGVCELFPGEVIHIGGDECPASSWAKCPKCKVFMKREGIGELKGMQPWLTRHLAKYLKSKGKRVSGWEEIAVGLGKLDKWGESENLSSLPENMLPPNDSLVMGYHTRPAALAANIGYEVVSCPTWHCYFDYSQKIQDDPHLYHRPDIRWCPLDAAFNYDPYECVNPDARNRIVGVECCNWAGKTRNVTELEWKMWPRMFAFAEVAWRNEEPAKRDFAEFLERAAVHRARLIREHVNCAPLK